MHQDVFEIDQLGEMMADLTIGPDCRVAVFLTREAHVDASYFCRGTAGRDMAVEKQQELPRMRREFIERATQDFRC